MALGLDPVEQAAAGDWQRMFDVNALGTLRVTQALLPVLERSGAGTIVMISSTAGLITYEGGGGYAAAKHGQTVVAETLRLELSGRPVRVIEIDPGMVRTDEFAVNRFAGDTERAAAVYAGVAEPLVAEDIADCVAWVATRPQHVNVDRLVIRPLAQAAQHKVHRVLP
jgi:NADP-dependent 3-hydroxy acid dehydrogenase YdfG